MGKGEHVGDYTPPTDTERERTQGLRAMLRNANLELPRTMRIPANGGEARAILFRALLRRMIAGVDTGARLRLKVVSVLIFFQASVNRLSIAPGCSALSTGR